MNKNQLEKYLRTQGELGGFEIILAQKVQPAAITKPSIITPPVTIPPLSKSPAITQSETQNDSLWKNSTDIKQFHEALQKHSIYTKSMRALNFYAPTSKEIKTNPPLLLLFHSPQELTTEAKGMLERLFKKLGIDLNACAISFFFKCDETAYPREKRILKEMLCKEIELINPEKVIFFREAPLLEQTQSPAKINAQPILFAQKPLITLYSLLEMLPSKPNFKEKMNEVLNICQAQLLPQQ